MENTKDKIELMASALVARCRTLESKEAVGNEIVKFSDNIIKLLDMPKIDDITLNNMADSFWFRFCMIRTSVDCWDRTEEQSVLLKEEIKELYKRCFLLHFVQL